MRQFLRQCLDVLFWTFAAIPLIVLLIVTGIGCYVVLFSDMSLSDADMFFKAAIVGIFATVIWGIGLIIAAFFSERKGVATPPHVC